MRYKSSRRNRQVEDILQIQCAAFLWRFTDLEWYHPSPNVYRSALALFAPPAYCQKVGAEGKKKGVRAGVPDIFIMDTPPRYPEKKGVYIELKTKKGSLSDAQKEFRFAAESRGYLFFVVRESTEELQEILEDCGYKLKIKS